MTPIVPKSRSVVTPAAVHRGRIGEWTLIIDGGVVDRLATLRAGRLPNETGGVLLGAYDMDRRAIYVADTIPSPPDSVEWPTLYIRGCEGLPAAVASAAARTGRQLEYIGEWHSHPDRCSTRPSDDDLQVFAWLTERMAVEGLPALMAIAGGRDFSWYLGEMRSDAGWSVGV
jgi:integrative and conjugative element protein (TIGR02256 family)